MLIHLDDEQGQDSAPWVGCTLENQDLKTEQNNHGTESCPASEPCPDPAATLALEHLEEIGWGQKAGYQVRDPQVLLERYGAPAVLG